MGSCCRSRATADHRRHARHQRFLRLLRADPVNMRIHAARGDDLAFSGDRFCSYAYWDCDVRLNIRVTCFANGEDPAVFDANIRFNDPPVIDDQRVGYYQIHARLRAHLTLTHTVADHFSAAKFDLFAVGGEVFFYFDPQFRICQPYFIAGCRAKHVNVSLPGQFIHCLPPVHP